MSAILFARDVVTITYFHFRFMWPVGDIRGYSVGRVRSAPQATKHIRPGQINIYVWPAGHSLNINIRSCCVKPRADHSLTIHETNIFLMLAHRLRRRRNNKPALGQCIDHSAMSFTHQCWRLGKYFLIKVWNALEVRDKCLNTEAESYLTNTRDKGQVLKQCQLIVHDYMLSAISNILHFWN